MANSPSDGAHDAHAHHKSHHHSVEVAVEGAVLVCHQTPTGSWICCNDDGTQSCARGFSPDSAAARWEEAQRLAE